MSEASNSRSSRTRGRIANVLAEARATLKEPSRPVTPASLDARLDLIPGASYGSGGVGSRGSLSRANSGGRRGASGSKVDNFLYSNKAAIKKKNSSSDRVEGRGYAKSKATNDSVVKVMNSEQGGQAEHFIFDQQNYEEDNGDISFYDDSNQSGSSRSGGGGSHGDIALLTMDIADNVSVLETELQQAGEEGLEPHMAAQLLDNMTVAIDKFTKYMKATLFTQHTELYESLVDTLAKILDATPLKSLRQTVCRHLLRLLLAKYPSVPSTAYTATGPAPTAASYNDQGVCVTLPSARVLLRTTRDLYLCAGEDGGDKVVEQEGAMVQGGIDQILDFLAVVWGQAEAAFRAKDGFSSASSTQEGEKLFGNAGAFKMFLEAGVYAAGIIRIYSTKETNRRRLCHIGAVAGLSGGLRTVLHIITSVNRDKEENRGRGRERQHPGCAAARRDESIALSQLGYIVVQVTATVRNFTLEAAGRKELLANSTVVAVCHLLHSFQSNAELLLNCVRVTAKLSQFEPFRVQLNKKPKYVSFLAGVIINEGELCRRVMDGEGGEHVAWPSWHTWPLLSRAAFTLGNLTTNNDANRLLIANTCKCLMPLIILLQTCSCSLMHLCASDNVDESSEEEDEGFDDEDFEVEDDDRELDGAGDEGEIKSSDIISSTEFSTDKEPSKKTRGGYVPTSFDSTTSSSQQDNTSGTGPGNTAAAGSENVPYTEDDGCTESELNDATVKLLRLFANLTINETIGTQLAKRKDTSKMLLELLACSDSGGGEGSGDGSNRHEELHLNVVAACTNLTFYSCRVSDDDSPSLAPQTVHDLQSLATRLAHCLFHVNKEVVLESARALGNLTRNEQVIESLCSNRAAEALVLLLDHSDWEVLMAVTGALVNISANVNSLSCLAESQQPALSLALILRKASFKHLQLSTLVCQVFHNLLLHEKGGFDEVVRGALGDSLFELVDTAEDMISDDDDEEEEEGGESEEEYDVEEYEGDGEGRSRSRGQRAGGGGKAVSESRQRYEQFVRVGRMVLDFLTIPPVE